MRDGTVLRADVYHPKSPGRFPALLQRTPYSKTVASLRDARHPSRLVLPVVNR
jgi:uncharacterized protein